MPARTRAHLTTHPCSSPSLEHGARCKQGSSRHVVEWRIKIKEEATVLAVLSLVLARFQPRPKIFGRSRRVVARGIAVFGPQEPCSLLEADTTRRERRHAPIDKLMSLSMLLGNGFGRFSRPSPAYRTPIRDPRGPPPSRPPQLLLLLAQPRR